MSLISHAWAGGFFITSATLSLIEMGVSVENKIISVETVTYLCGFQILVLLNVFDVLYFV